MHAAVESTTSEKQATRIQAIIRYTRGVRVEESSSIPFDSDKEKFSLFFLKESKVGFDKLYEFCSSFFFSIRKLFSIQIM